MGRIGIDATSITPSGKGIARVQREITRQLSRSAHGHEIVAFVRTQEAADSLGGLGVTCDVVAFRRSIVWELWGLPRASARRGLDVILSTSDRLPLSSAPPVVTWLYEVPTHRIELNRLHRAGTYQRVADTLTQLLWRRSLRRASVILAGSEATAREITGAAPQISGKLRVVHPGLDPSFRPDEGRVESSPYLLAIATSDGRDNTEVLLHAYARIRSTVEAPPRLRLPGGLGSRESAVRATIASLGLDDAVDVLGRVSDAELIALYQHALAYLDASLYEGFGYQVLEAMACGAPVVVSNATSIPEVVGDAGVLCDPTDPEAFAAGVLQLLHDPSFAAECRRRGLERSSTFTWERSAKNVLAALEDALAA